MLSTDVSMLIEIRGNRQLIRCAIDFADRISIVFSEVSEVLAETSEEKAKTAPAVIAASLKGTVKVRKVESPR